MTKLWLLFAVACASYCGLGQSSPPAASPDSLVTWVANRIPPSGDSLMVFRMAHRAVRLSKNANNPEFLGRAFENLAAWHLGAPTIDSSLHYLQLAQMQYTSANNDAALAQLYLQFEATYKERSLYSKAEPYAFKALEHFEQLEDARGIAETQLRLSDLFYYQDNYEDGKKYAKNAIAISEAEKFTVLRAIGYRYLANNQLFADEPEAALPNASKSVAILEEANEAGLEMMASKNTLGNIFKYLGRYSDALTVYQYNLVKARDIENYRFEIASLGNIGHVYLLQEEYAQALPYFLRSIDIIERTGQKKNLWENYMHTSVAYEEMGDYKNALKYDILYGRERMAYLQSIIERLESELQAKYEAQKKEETIANQEDRIARQRTTQFLYLGISILLAAFVIAMFVTLKNIRRKRKKLALLNTQLQQERKALNHANNTLTETIANLKSTQAQLIQSEKMASLGELTAGIAHEIQNPLNFVNNFSEVSKEMLDEMKDELATGNYSEVREIVNDLSTNLEKIGFHGKRADGIVKGMLQHSRKSTGERKATDVNTLVDEYLRLAYHGLRAKDKSFNASMITDYGSSVNELEIVPQEIGRVILNLISNAFFAVNQRKLESASNTSKTTYEPTVWIATQRVPAEGKNTDHTVEISVKDNGTGMPSEIVEKIFQPFFTTKPTGQGTGLGLSLSYDIVKAHGGEIRVYTEKDKGTEFVISLPAKH